VDARTRRIAGWVVAAVGVVVAVIGGLADQVGLGGEGADEFGPKQVVALVVGIVLVAVGLALALWRPAEPVEPGPT
jgi:sulfite exporter TauE/SafE